MIPGVKVVKPNYSNDSWQVQCATQECENLSPSWFLISGTKCIVWTLFSFVITTSSYVRPICIYLPFHLTPWIVIYIEHLLSQQR
jgi:uncharacterized protein with PQ loop repeat